MRKGITPIIATVLLILITVVSVAASFFWVTSLGANLQEQAGTTIRQDSTSTCLSINLISMRGDEVTIQNTGCDTISSISLLIDGVLTNYDLSTPLAPGESGVISFSSLAELKRHCIKIVLGSGTGSELCSSAEHNIAESGYGLTSNETVEGCQELEGSCTNMWFTGAITGNDEYCACCGNSGANDNFYNGSISNTTYFCNAGSFINQHIDTSRTLCEYYDYNWISNADPIVYTFSNDAAGSTPSGLILYNTAGFNDSNSWFNISDYYNGRSKVINVSFTADSTDYKVWTFDPFLYAPLGNVTVEFWMASNMTGPSETQQGLGLFLDSDGSGGAPSLQHYYNGSSIVRFFNNSENIPIGNFIPGVWYKYKLIADITTERVFIYQNDILLYNDNMDMKKGIAALGLYSAHGDISTNLYYDDIRVTSPMQTGPNCCGDDGSLDNFHNSTDYCCNGILNSGSCFCGDGRCQMWENPASCSLDCKDYFSAVFDDNMGGLRKISYGNSWGVINYNLFEGTNPRVTIDDDGTMWMTYVSSGTIYVRNSTSNTTNWNAASTISSDAGIREPDIAAGDNGMKMVVYGNSIDSNIYVRISDDGISWSSESVIEDSALTNKYSRIPSITYTHGKFFITYPFMDFISFKYGVRLASSSDGLVWDYVDIYNDSNDNYYFSDVLGDSEGNLYLNVYDDMGMYSPLFKKSTDSGVSWTDLTLEGGLMFNSHTPMIQANDGKIVGVYMRSGAFYLLYSLDKEYFQSYGPVSETTMVNYPDLMQIPNNDYVIFYDDGSNIYVEHLPIIPVSVASSIPSWVRRNDGMIHMIYTDSLYIYSSNSSDGLIFSSPTQLVDDIMLSDPSLILDKRGNCLVSYIASASSNITILNATDCINYDQLVSIGPSSVYSFQTMIQDNSGVYWIIYRNSSNGYTYMINALNPGVLSNWSEPVIIFQVDYNNPNMMQDDGGKYWMTMTNESQYVYITNSNDGVSWSAPIRFGYAGIEEPFIMQDYAGNYHVFIGINNGHELFSSNGIDWDDISIPTNTMFSNPSVFNWYKNN
ncbi:BNR repeat-like domain protein [uncultured archaeon]|nr:BNR repeat-like domain protein [uncultured archaeon]